MPVGFNNNNNNNPNTVHNYSTVAPAIATLSPEDQEALIAAQRAQMERTQVASPIRRICCRPLHLTMRLVRNLKMKAVAIRAEQRSKSSEERV